jgi:decaprenyl-phosphate phosphoribosyltransferase
MRTHDPAEAAPATAETGTAPRPTLRGHVRMCRVDHWAKNVFVLPGIVLAISADQGPGLGQLVLQCVVGLLAVSLVASSNYVINEIKDAPFDLYHPVKRHRPVPSGEVSVPLAYVQWIGLGIVGLALGAAVTWPLAATLLGLWVMGCLYNLPPIRTKDRPYLDVLSEAINNPLRLLAGWYMVTAASVPPLSALVSYWMIGCYFMAIKRYAEYRDLRDGAGREVQYRKSFAYYTEERLLASIIFYASAATLFFGAFAVRYRIELVLAFPFLAFLMAVYLHLAFRPDSPTEHPEKLYRERPLMISVTLCAALMTVLLFVDLPFMHDLFSPTEEFGARVTQSSPPPPGTGAID